jgi:allophanate hydrolase
MPASPLDIRLLRGAYLAGELTTARLLDRVLARIAAGDDPALWISRVDEAEIRARAEALDAAAAAEPGLIERQPLFGIPFAVKDNIDVAGVPTTAGCPAFAYMPDESAPVVTRLIDAGAVFVGKTNLDQFATGLVGTRSPYGVPRNPFDARFIPGGSSSGSAVAVASGLVGFALGTDTAGSGRVPAAFNNIVGLKPTRGLLSTRGVVPACRSLDCVSIFAPAAADAATVFEIAAWFDPDDPLSRALDRGAPRQFGPTFLFGVPMPSNLEFFGDVAAPALYATAVRRLETIGGTPVEINLAPFFAAGRLLYDGPWLAERLEATEALLRDDPYALLPVTRAIIEGGKTFRAIDAFRALHDLAALRRETDRVFALVDLLLLPTAGRIFQIAEIEAEPLRLNAVLGRYTNFVNLLDLAAIALPAGFNAAGLPFGVSLIAPGFADRALLNLAQRYEAAAVQSSPTDSPASSTGSG